MELNARAEKIPALAEGILIYMHYIASYIL